VSDQFRRPRKMSGVVFFLADALSVVLYFSFGIVRKYKRVCEQFHCSSSVLHQAGAPVLQCFSVSVLHGGKTGALQFYQSMLVKIGNQSDESDLH